MEKVTNCHGPDLVSIVVITYNSGQFVLETLESIKAQSYPNIELIVSDDCSIDDTLIICQQWIQLHKKRFASVELVTSKVNSGIPANCNRGIRRANGRWIKIIAGDDALLPDCIISNLDFIRKNPRVDAVCSRSRIYQTTLSESSFVGVSPSDQNIRQYYQDDLSAYDQFHQLMYTNFIEAPTVILKKEIIESVGYFDESFRLMEDYPMWIKITKAGHKFHFLNKDTIKQRHHRNSTGSFYFQLINPPTFYIKEHMKRVYVYPYVGFLTWLNLKTKFHVKDLMIRLGMNKATKINVTVDTLLTKYLNPFEVISFCHKLLTKYIHSVKESLFNIFLLPKTKNTQ